MRHSIRLGPGFDDVGLSWLEHGDPDGEPVVCVHGLTRNAHDFDHLAGEVAARGRRVLAVDVVGRGGSSWLADPDGYQLPVYADHLARWLELLGLDRVDWVGTSMGGLVGIVLAAREASAVRRLVLNDIGPSVPAEALAGIRSYLALDPVFADLASLEAHLRLIHAGFGELTDEEWRSMARHSGRESGGGWRMHYDPAIRVPFLATADAGIDLWVPWDAIRCPTFVLHGAESALLTPAVLDEMRRRRPEVETVTLPGLGHAPALNTDEQVGIVLRWLGCS